MSEFEALQARIPLTLRYVATMSETAKGLRYAEEGDRAETYPEIVFRSGPAGRRAGLIGGPDVWEVVLVLRQSSDVAEASERLAEEMSISADRVAVALRYAAKFPEEIEARIALHEHETARYESLAGG